MDYATISKMADTAVGISREAWCAFVATPAYKTVQRLEAACDRASRRYQAAGDRVDTLEARIAKMQDELAAARAMWLEASDAADAAYRELNKTRRVAYGSAAYLNYQATNTHAGELILLREATPREISAPSDATMAAAIDAMARVTG